MTELEESDRYSRATWLWRPGFGPRPPGGGLPSDLPPRSARGPARPGGTLVSSAHGEIARIALALPRFYFTPPPPDAFSLHDVLRRFNLDLYEMVLRTLPEGCECVVVSEAHDDAKAFVETVRPKRPNFFVPAKTAHSTWIQDPFCAVTEGGATRLVEPEKFRDPGDEQLADVIGHDRGIARSVSDDHFEGGNVLAGREHWFLGADSGGELAANRDIAGLEAKYAEIGTGRKLVLVSVEEHVTVEAERERPRAGATEAPCSEQIFARNTAGTRQPLFHIDAFMTVATDGDGREVVLIGSPREARKYITGGGDWPEDAAMDLQFDSVERVIRAQVPKSLRIIRIPMPLFAVDTKKVRRWRFATYANALLQRDAQGQGTAWLPTFQGEGEHAWAAVAPVDDEVERIYRQDLGYQTVHRLPDSRAFAYYIGGPHCVFNYLARK